MSLNKILSMVWAGMGLYQALIVQDTAVGIGCFIMSELMMQRDK